MIPRLVLATLLLAATTPASAATPAAGDEQPRLQALAERYVEGRHSRAIALWARLDGREYMAFAGPLLADDPAPAQAYFEIGSITKVLTAWAVAEEVRAGRLAWSATLGQLAPRGTTLDPAVASITLEELARHTSGLPRLGTDFTPMARAVLTSDPYAGSTSAELWATAAALTPESLTPRGRNVYSNLGYALLGEAAARAAGLDVPAFLRRNVLVPAGAVEVGFREPGDAPRRELAGTRGNGLPAPHWHLGAYGGAGGAIASLDDMRVIALALTASPAALAPYLARPERLEEGRHQPGLGLVHTLQDGVHYVWHNGGTGGFATMMAVSPQTGDAVVVLSSGNEGVEPLAWAVVNPPGRLPEPGSPWRAALALGGLVLAPVLAWMLLRQGLRGGRKRAADRLDLFYQLLGVLSIPIVALELGQWWQLPVIAWWASAAATLVLIALVVRRHAGALPWNTSGAAGLTGRLLLALLGTAILALIGQRAVIGLVAGA